MVSFSIVGTPPKITFEDDDISDLFPLSTERFQASKANTDYRASGNFLVVLNYYEQLTCAIRNLLVFGYVAQNLGAKLVSPYLLHSRLYGIPDLIGKAEIPGEFLPLETVFDVDKLNETLNFNSGSCLVNFENFIRYAPREITIVDQVRGHAVGRDLTLDNKHLRAIYNMMNQTKTKAYDCTSHIPWDHWFIQRTHLMLRKYARLFDVQEFKISEYICISTTVDVTTTEIKYLIGPEPRTIVFTQYRGCAYRSCNERSPHTINQPTRNRILYHSNNFKPAPPNQIINSLYKSAIKQTALQYLQIIQIDDPFISLHIRIEKLQRVNRVFNKQTECCLQLLQSLIEVLRKQYVDRIMMITDMGEYGSDSCSDLYCIKYVRKFRQRLTTMELEPYSFNPELTNSSKSSAFASLVEMHMLAMGDRLVVMGAGSFKYQVITQFSISNPSNKVYHICTDQGNILNEFSHLGKDCS
ncbi:uncharacterized protein [Dysidea avara]